MKVYSVRGFLDADLCRRIRMAMDRGAAEPAEVLRDQMTVEELVRHATSIEVDATTLDLVEQSLDTQRSVLEKFFGESLGAREGTNFLRYDNGGFYLRHRDRARIASWPGAARRRLTVVVFLNSGREADTSGSFTGGTLCLFPEGEEQTIDIHPREGTLVAFPATLRHEVALVRSGTRDTIVDWFY